MARDITALGDAIDFGSDTSIDAFTTKSLLVWVDQDTTTTTANIATKTAWAFGHQDEVLAPDHLEFNEAYSILSYATDSANNSVPSPAAYVVGFNITGTTLDFFYDGGTIADTPIGGTGTKNSDAADTLYLGRNAGSGFDGRVQNFVYDDTAFTAAHANRHKWWGRPIGGPSTVSVMHPLLTDKLTNEGTATADGTTSAAMASLPKTARPFWGLGY